MIGATTMDMKSCLNEDELRYFLSKSDAHAFGMFIFTWLSIFIVFFIVYQWTNPLTLFLAIVLLAGRQLGLAVLMHECGHNTLFKTKKYNPLFGQWFAANMVFADLPSYARGHLKHHKFAGTENDPDLNNYKNYPISSDSFKRKIKRDLTGKTGIKLLQVVWRGLKAYGNVETRHNAKPFVQEVLVQFLFFTALSILMAPWLYLLWIVSYITTYMVVVRLRQVAEHGAVPNLYDDDPRNNTRTTIPNGWERLIFAPNYVNYHLEHHFMAGVPAYRLKALHKLLKSRGAFQNTPIVYGYRAALGATIKF